MLGGCGRDGASTDFNGLGHVCGARTKVKQHFCIDRVVRMTANFGLLAFSGSLST